MNDFEKAKALITDKSVSLVELHRRSKIPYQFLRNARWKPDSLQKTEWRRVHLLAQIYDKKSVDGQK